MSMLAPRESTAALQSPIADPLAALPAFSSSFGHSSKA